jgi:hypothetical protein
MHRYHIRRALLPLLVLCLTLFGGASLASAQTTGEEPDAGATPETTIPDEANDETVTSDSGAVTCVVSTSKPGESLPHEEGGTTVTVDISITVSDSGAVTVSPATGGTGETIVVSEGDGDGAATGVNDVPNDPAAGSGVTKAPGDLPAGEGEKCAVIDAGGEHAVPADEAEEPATGSEEAAPEVSDTTATPEAESCTVTKETTLPDGTNEKVLSCTSS